MVSQLYTTLNIALSLSYLPLSSGLRSCSLSTRHLDDDRQVVLGGVAEEPLVHGHHLHHPHLLHRHDPPLLLRMLRRHEGDQVLPAHVRDPDHHINFHKLLKGQVWSCSPCTGTTCWCSFFLSFSWWAAPLLTSSGSRWGLESIASASWSATCRWSGPWRQRWWPTCETMFPKILRIPWVDHQSRLTMFIMMTSNVPRWLVLGTRFNRSSNAAAFSLSKSMRLGRCGGTPSSSPSSPPSQHDHHHHHHQHHHHHHHHHHHRHHHHHQHNHHHYSHRPMFRYNKALNPMPPSSRDGTVLPASCCSQSHQGG